MQQAPRSNSKNVMLRNKYKNCTTLPKEQHQKLNLNFSLLWWNYTFQTFFHTVFSLSIQHTKQATETFTQWPEKCFNFVHKCQNLEKKLLRQSYCIWCHCILYSIMQWPSGHLCTYHCTQVPTLTLSPWRPHWEFSHGKNPASQIRWTAQ